MDKHTKPEPGPQHTSMAMPLSAHSLQCALLPKDADCDTVPHGMHVLGRVQYGHAQPCDGPRTRDNSDLHVPLTTDGKLWQECWYSNTPVRDIRHGPVKARCNGQVLWGCFSLPLQAHASCVDAVQHHYLQLLEMLRETGFTHLWRIWNFVSHINAADAIGLETYRAFNTGRAGAFARFFDQGDQNMRRAMQQMPAATAVGCGGESIHVYFLAGRQAARHIENPRQSPAYHYPAEYGPRPPSFARASAVALNGHDMLFISGTASIIGHSSVHIGDLAGQCRTTVENLQIVAGRAGRTLQQLGYFKAYVRHAHDVPAARSLLQALLGVSAGQITCFVADICRQNLLVEVEAMQL